MFVKRRSFHSCKSGNVYLSRRLARNRIGRAEESLPIFQLYPFHTTLKMPPWKGGKITSYSTRLQLPLAHIFVEQNGIILAYRTKDV